MGKNCSDNLHSIKNTGNNLTLKQMFDMSEKLMVGQSDGIFGVTPIKSSVSHMQRFTYFRILCYVDIGMNSNTAAESDLSPNPVHS